MNYYIIEHTPLGPISVGYAHNAVCAVRFGAAEESRPSDIALRAECQLREYFAGERREFDLPLLLSGSDFQRKVWHALTKIPYGKTCTYADIARAVGNPRACRAVGGANHKNPICILIPCHRVVAKNGIGGYGEGIAIKKFLLELEQGGLS